MIPWCLRDSSEVRSWEWEVLRTSIYFCTSYRWRKGLMIVECLIRPCDTPGLNWDSLEGWDEEQDLEMWIFWWILLAGRVGKQLGVDLAGWHFSLLACAEDFWQHLARVRTFSAWNSIASLVWLDSSSFQTGLGCWWRWILSVPFCCTGQLRWGLKF